MRDVIRHYTLEDYVTIIDAPLVDVMVDVHEYQWYLLEDLDQVKIDMLVIDGPPGKLQRHSRFPTIPLLHK